MNTNETTKHRRSQKRANEHRIGFVYPQLGVSLTEADITRLNEMCRVMQRSRSDLIREAIRGYLDQSLQAKA